MHTLSSVREAVEVQKAVCGLAMLSVSGSVTRMACSAGAIHRVLDSFLLAWLRCRLPQQQERAYAH